jgi:hypothetical protein
MRPLPRIEPAVSSKSAKHGERAGAAPPAVKSSAPESRRSWRRMMWHDPALAPHIAAALWEAPDRLVASGTMLKEGDRCTVVRIDAKGSPEGLADGQPKAAKQAVGPAGDRWMILKRYNIKGSFHTATHMLLRSRAQWGWVNARRLLGAGLMTPRPLACVEERRHGVLRLGSCLLTSFVPGRSLSEVIQSGSVSKEDLRDFATQFVSIWRTLGMLRAGHGDMKASNFVVDASKKLWLIDLDGMRMYRSGVLLRRERRNDLARFMLNWQGQPEVAAIFRARIGTG